MTLTLIIVDSWFLQKYKKDTKNRTHNAASPSSHPSVHRVKFSSHFLRRLLLRFAVVVECLSSLTLIDWCEPHTRWQISFDVKMRFYSFRTSRLDCSHRTPRNLISGCCCSFHFWKVAKSVNLLWHHNLIFVCRQKYNKIKSCLSATICTQPTNNGTEDTGDHKNNYA